LRVLIESGWVSAGLGLEGLGPESGWVSAGLGLEIEGLGLGLEVSKGLVSGSGCVSVGRRPKLPVT